MQNAQAGRIWFASQRKRETRGQAGEIAAAQTGPSTPAEQQQEKNGEDQRTGGVAEDVDEQRLVERDHGSERPLVALWAAIRMTLFLRCGPPPHEEPHYSHGH